ncbi:MAG TPA: type II secretion system protein GspE, partial [Chthonomonadaceae bacterium]|nr:type II secretion system protein GspE [Chthonomonadaceae bacterium]
MLKLRRTLLGALLVEDGLVTHEQLEVALAEQRRGDGSKRIGEILVQLRYITDQNLLRMLSVQLDCPIVDLNQEPPEADVLDIVPS